MRIRAKNVKGRSFDLELPKLGVISAPVGSGKSAIAEAARFGLLGFVPFLGRRPADTAALMSGGRMEVELVLDDGRVISRAIEQTAKGLTQEAAASWIEVANATAASEAMRLLVGADEIAAAEAMDVRELLRASPNQRAARIEGLLQAGAATPESLARDVLHQAVCRLCQVDPAQIADYRQLARPESEGGAGALPPDQYSLLKRLVTELLAKIKGAGIPGATTWANAEKRDAAARHRQDSEAERSLAARVKQLPEVTPERIAELEGERSRLEQELGAIRERNAAPERRRNEIAEAARALNVSRTHLSVVQDARDGWASHGAGELATKRERAAELERDLEQLAPPWAAADEDPEITRLEVEAAEAEARAGRVEIPTIPSSAEAQARVDSLRARIAEAESSPWSRVVAHAEAIDQAVERGAEGRVTMASDIRSETDGLRALAGQYTEGIAGLRHSLEQTEERLAADVREADRMTSLRAHRQREAEGLIAEARRARNRAAELRTAVREHERQSFDAYAQQRAEVERELKALKPAIAALEERERRTAEAIRQAEADVAVAEKRIQAIQGEIPEVEDAGLVQDALTKVRGELKELQAAATARDELARLVAGIAAAATERVIYSALEWGCQEIRKREVTAAGGPLVAHMRRFFEAGGRREIPYFRAEKTSCEIGWDRGGQKIRVEALSGGEWQLFAAALTAAVIALRGASVRLLLVEAAETDDLTFEQLLRGVEAISGDLTAALVLTCHPVEIRPAWTVITSLQRGAVAGEEAA